MRRQLSGAALLMSLRLVCPGKVMQRARHVYIYNVSSRHQGRTADAHAPPAVAAARYWSGERNGKRWTRTHRALMDPDHTSGEWAPPAARVGVKLNARSDTSRQTRSIVF